MRLHFKRVRYKNILSTGNNFTTIDLDRRDTTLISGTNGSGKSTLLDAIVFGLYGKPFRKINKPQLINSINKKDLLVEVEFTIGGHDYLIRRGIKPNVFEIYKGNQLVNQDSATRDYQEYLEQYILGINYKAFNQIVVLGSATYVPFMELPAHNRREIIEDLLDIQVFSTMNLLVKEKIQINNTSTQEVKYQLELVENRIESAKEHNESIRKMKELEVDKIREKIRDQIKIVEDENTAKEFLEVEIEKLITSISDKKTIQKKLRSVEELELELGSKHKQLFNEVNFYENHDNCPTCKQGIQHDFKTETVAKHNEKLEELDKAREDLKQKRSDIESRLKEIVDIEEKINEDQLKIGEHRAHVKIATGVLKNLKSDLENAEKQVEEIDVSKLQQLQEESRSKENEYKKYLEEKNVLSVVSTILKDGGIKSRIIRQYIPVMNKLINKYLSAFDLFVDFHLDENFNEEIRSRFRDTFSYSSFSEGEKLRITLSIMLAWRAVAKLRNSVSTNLLILDETLDGALDGVGIESLIDTLHGLNNDDNIFVISHRGDQFAEKFAAHIKFQKVKNFSEIV